ncbi:MAG: spondin domain-containing protein [Chloroflexota bacterium]
MQPRIRRAAAAVTAASLVLAFAIPAVAASTRTYEVTIQLVSGGQPLTPPLIATHSGGTGVFSVGQPASFGVKEIAENGNLAPLITALGADPEDADVAAAAAPLVPPGSPEFGTFSDRVTLTIDADPGARFLSYQSMLICTNDGFTGLDRVQLPNQVGDSLSVGTASYDAGTEINTEDFADIVPPCQALMGVSSGEAGTGMSDPALAEGGVIHHHPGIEGGADLLPDVHGPILSRWSQSPASADRRERWPASWRSRPSLPSVVLLTCGPHLQRLGSCP